jgi:hypothetical protein
VHPDVTPTSASPVIDFTPASDLDIVAYNLYRAAGTCATATFSGPPVATGNGSATSITDATVPRDGDYCYMVRSFDGVNESANSGTADVHYNASPPSPPTNVHPDVNPTHSAPVIDFTPAGDLDIVAYNLYRAAGTCATATFSGPPVATGNGSATSITDATVPRDGDYCYMVRSFDGVNESANSGTADVHYDATPPPPPVSASLQNGKPGGYLNVQPIIAFDTTGHPDDVEQYRLYRRGADCSGTGTMVDSGDSSVTQLTDTSLASDGTYCYVVRAWDGVQESVDSQQVEAIYDTTPPDTSFTLQPPDPTNDTTPSFAFESIDTPQATFECRLDSAAFAPCITPDDLNVTVPGTHTFQVRAIDQAGNVDPTPAIATWFLDLTPPDVTFNSGPSGYVASTSADLTFNASETSTFDCSTDGINFTPCTGSGTHQVVNSSDHLSGLSQGQQSLRVRATDQAGNQTIESSTSWIVDTVPPVTSIDTHPGNPTGSQNASFSFSASDASPIDHYTCSLDAQPAQTCTSPASYSGLAQGQHHFTVDAFDRAGNDDTASFTWTINTNAPLVSIDGGPTGWTNQQSVSFPFHGVVHNPGDHLTFRCQLDGGPTTVCTSPQEYTHVSEGTHVFTLKATDVELALTATTTQSFKVDLTPPTDPQLTTPQPAAIVGGTTATNLTASASDPGGSGVQSFTFEYSTDGSSWTPIGSSDPAQQTLAWNTTGLPSGTYDIHVVATDAVGNSSTSPSVLVTLDNDPPLLSSIMAGGSGVVSGGSAPLGVVAADAAGGAGLAATQPVAFSVAGAVVQPGAATDLGSGHFAATWNTMAEQDGTYTLTATAQDALGNIGTTSMQVRVDNHAPDPPAAPTGPTLTNQAPVLTWSAPAPGADVLGFNVYRNGIKLNASPLPTTTTTFTDALPTNGSADGAYLYTITATDTSKESGQSAPLAVSLDTTRPLAVTSVTASENAGAVTVSWPAAADPTAGGFASGIAGYVVRRSAADGPAPSTPGEGTSMCAVGAGSLSCTDTATVTGATYAYSVFASDAAGNWSSAASASVTVKGPVIPDTTPPGRPAHFHASALTNTGGRLEWDNPRDSDFDHVIVVSGSKRPTEPSKGKRVYAGKSTHATFKARAGSTVQFAIFAFDQSGNMSHGSFVAVKVPNGPLSPATGATLTGSPMLTWKPVKDASYYNVQLYIGTKRTYSAWPKGTSYRVPASKLTSGRTYTWYVWPGFGALRAAKYGKLIGKATFHYHR